MAPRTKAALEELAKNVETLQMMYEDIYDELKEAVDEVPQNQLKIKARIKIFQAEAFPFMDMKLEYEKEAASVNGNTDEHKQRVRDAFRLIREGQELLNIAKLTVGLEGDEESVYLDAQRDVPQTNRRKLPKLNIPTFSGEIRDWLAFWSQFQEIENDKTVPAIDKFQYLIQAMKPGSLAQKIVQSYPVSSENYVKALESLKERYNRTSVLVKVYVRDLVKLIISNETKESVDFSNLYVQLSSQLRALESLEVTTDKCASIVLPLVECCLPVDILRAWQRDPSCGREDDSSLELHSLMEFLKREVRGEDNIRLACGGLTGEKGHREKTNSSFPRKASSGPITVTGLLNTSANQTDKHICIFCGFKHPSKLCRKAAKMAIEDRRKILREKNRCFNCLEDGHQARKCTAGVQCPQCNGNHLVVMCNSQSGKTSEQEARSTVDDKRISSTNISCGAGVFLKTLCVLVQGQQQDVQARVLLDGGSHKSYVVTSLTEQQQLKSIGVEQVIHSLFGGVKSSVTQHNRYRVGLSDLEGKYSCQVNLSDSNTVSGNIQCYAKGPWTTELAKMGITLSDGSTNDGPVQILLGADVMGHIMTGRQLKLKCGPWAVETKLGWVLFGETEDIYRPISSSKQVEFYEEKPPVLTTTMLCSSAAERLTSFHVPDDPVEKLWSLDSLGIKDPTEKVTKLERDANALKNFNESSRVDEEGRIEVRLPWMTDHRTLPDYKWFAGKRLLATTNKLIQDKKLDAYHEVFQLWENLGIIEEVPLDELDKPSHYLQHRAVYNPNSTTTPIRPVFNASFKTRGQASLNDCLEVGPNLLELIPVLITRFRLNQVGVLADITKAFQQISVNIQDRDSLRFLWWENLRRQKIRVFRHRRVVFGVNSSPFLLAAVLKFIVQLTPEEKKKLAADVMKSMYVDNLIKSVPSFSEAEDFKSGAIGVLSTAKMELRGWEIGPCEEEKTVGLLGMKWNMKRDALMFAVAVGNVQQEEPVTRRKILSITNSVFDPLGLLTPFLLNFKRLVQETWIVDGKKIDWDEPLCEDVQTRFWNLYSQLESVPEVEIPRWITGANSDRSAWSLHVFVDGSKDAYAAAAYLRIDNGHNAEVHLLQSRSRVTPLKELTIPKIELLSCAVGARLAEFVRDSLEYPEITTYMWTDSSTALHWITQDSDGGVLVRNRVREISKLTDKTQWNHIPGVTNPADLPSRGCNIKQLLESRWWEGPEWLHEQQDLWPKSSAHLDWSEIQEEEMKTVVTSVNISNEEKQKYEDICKLSTYDEMLAATGQTGVYVSREESENCLLKLVQRNSFSGKLDSRLKRLPLLDDGGDLIKLKTRLFYSSFEEQFRCPIILPSESPVVHALIMDTHVKNSHGKVGFLRSKLREKFWILRDRRTIRSVLDKCHSCRRLDCQGIRVNSPPLPIERVEAENPFEVTGIDLCGPLFLKNRTKVWIVLFTCAVYRAVHLELVTGLTTGQLKLALRRFVSRRGKPRIIFSDNGTNLVGCSNEIRSVDWNNLQTSAVGQAIEWRFIPPGAPWWGGFWERMIGVVKDLLRRTIGQAVLNHLELITILADVESTVNQRPLSYVSEDPSDLIPLTPAMFLIGNRSSKIPELDEVDGKALNKRLRYMQRLREDIRGRFKMEYLGQLNNLKQGKESPGLKVGETVLVEHDNKKKLEWPLGKIQELVKSRDGKFRVAVVRTDDGDMKRPIQRIYPLQVPFEGNKKEGQIKIPVQLTSLCVVQSLE